MVRIALLGEYNPTVETHIATNESISHSSNLLNQPISGEWISSDSINGEVLDRYDGLWVAPGPLHNAVENTLGAIRYAREGGIPTFGNCQGFQLLVVEIARNILGLSDAHHEEYSPTSDVRVVIPMSCSLRGQELPINLSASTSTARLYGQKRVVERYYCRYGINPVYRSQFLSAPISVSAVDDDGEIRAFEIPGHPFFLATLYVPQAHSRMEAPHPLVTGFLESCVLRHRARLGHLRNP